MQTRSLVNKMSNNNAPSLLGAASLRTPRLPAWWRQAEGKTVTMLPALRCAQDPVPRIPKSFYTHVGRRVTVDEEGDVIVRPSFFELSVLNRAGG